MLKKILPLLFLIFFLFSCQSTASNKINIIPIPLETSISKGHFTLNEHTRVFYSDNSEELSQLVETCISLIRPATNFPLELTQIKSQKNLIIFKLCPLDTSLSKESYQLDVTKDIITLRASTPQGLFYAFQTLRQLLPTEIEAPNLQNIKWKVPCVHIKDSPRFSWRGMQLDVVRHFMSTEFIKHYIDILSFYKMNKLHLHLTDDQGWRIEIKKYPQLTNISAWRLEKDGSIYGGFYTQEEIRDIIDYASQKNIDIIPEISIPGHSTAMLAAFPEISCSGGPFNVSNTWGIHNNVICPGKDSSYQIIENILSEIIELFPSGYIHIGGDEIPYEKWDSCLDCQIKIKQEHLSAKYKLQSYFFERIASYLKERNIKMIGREEIIRGGIPDNTTIQVWRSEKAGVTASYTGHEVIMSMYYNSYFHRSVFQTSLNKVYENKIIPNNIIEGKEKYILGGECCVCTEYMTEETINKRVFPRLIAYSETLWSYDKNKDFIKFYKSLKNHEKRLAFSDIYFGPEAEPISIKSNFDPALKKCFVTLVPKQKDISIHYCYSDKTPYYYSNSYMRPLVFDNGGKLTARAFVGTLPYGKILKWEHFDHLAMGIEPFLKNSYDKKYDAGGIYGLCDGIKGSHNFKDGAWQGFKSHNLDVVIDLKKKQKITSVSCTFLHNINVWIFIPQKVTFYISDDGVNFNEVASLKAQTPEKSDRVVKEDFTIKLLDTNTRYIKVVAINHRRCPNWHPSGGNHAWLFVDEIIVK